MSHTEELLTKAKAGFESLNLPEKYVNSAHTFLQQWLSEDQYAAYLPQLEYLINQEKWDLLLDSFYQVIPFGTGGRRGEVGIGPNRINAWTVQMSAQGHSQYLKKAYGEDAATRGVVLAYDVRVFTQLGIYNDAIDNPIMNLSCKDLAEAAAQVYTANGIKVYLFDDTRSTPELSFAIRHLNACAGAMISASHNPPNFNGKKVYDEFGGQLIPPFDEKLVLEVTESVTELKELSFEEAKKHIEFIGDNVDIAYHNEVEKLSLSDERDLKIVYSPLHGTGRTSFYPILKNLGFDIELDPKTSNFSGAFENVTFNIPNPEVRQSFTTALEYAKKVDADIILNSDPDADRIGIMVKHNGDYKYLNGNEIGIILTTYGFSKYKDLGKLTPQSTVIKTMVTTSLIKVIAETYGAQCIGELLVGFKYVGDEMNKLEQKGLIDSFVLGTEESHGFLMGNYARDKDGAAPAVWLAELAAELKRHNLSLVDYLDQSYAKFGYCYNFLTEIRLPGATGMDQIQSMQSGLRENPPSSFGRFTVKQLVDRWKGDPQPHLSATDTASRNVLRFIIEPVDNMKSMMVTIRPSGTEPKIKMYFETIGQSFNIQETAHQKQLVEELTHEFEKVFFNHCYNLIGVDFPERGFLLFWQMALKDKLKYFEIEQDIAALKEIDQSQRQEKLDQLLQFLGSDPIQKVDKAFEKKYGSGIRTYLELH